MAQSLSIALTGAGGAGVMTAGEMLLKLAAKAGYYGLMVRSSGPQIRGGEAAAFLRLSTHQVVSQGDVVDVLFAFDWNNVERFAAEIPLTENSLVMCDVKAGDPPAMVTDPGAKVIAVPLTETVKGIEGGRINMVGVGLIGGLLGLPEPVARQLIADTLGKKGDAAVEASIAGYVAGEKLAADAAASLVLNDAEPTGVPRWNISGNEATGLGAIKAGVRFVAAYPITPATEVLEWLAPNLERLGGTLVQAEDELASVNMILGGSFGGVPALTATAGPGLSLMTEAIGLAVASETPIVVVDVMRGGPSTGIPTKSEQTDLNIALYGLHGDAPHVVTAANSIPDCQFTAQWTVHLAEALQTAAILLTDQSLGQARAVVDKPADIAFVGKRETWNGETETYLRYANTASGVSPMAIPGTADGE
ncbi:MAG: 2-oxoacid:acceptor oxidoreductase family protein, partial [Magnetospiraceae bacterium]